MTRRRFLALAAGTWFVLVAARRYRKRGYSDIYYDEYGAYE